MEKGQFLYDLYAGVAANAVWWGSTMVISGLSIYWAKVKKSWSGWWAIVVGLAFFGLYTLIWAVPLEWMSRVIFPAAVILLLAHIDKINSKLEKQDTTDLRQKLDVYCRGQGNFFSAYVFPRIEADPQKRVEFLSNTYPTPPDWSKKNVSS